MSTPASPPATGPLSPAVIAWYAYDWANSAFPSVILTFVFAAYYSQAVAADPVLGAASWGHALSLAGLGVALLAPLSGAYADRSGHRKPWLGALSLVTVLATAALWTIEPRRDFMIPALVLVAVANIAFELSASLYNSLLPGLAPRDRIGLISGVGWGIGYGGGLVCLIVSLFALVQASPPPFGLDRGAAEHVRATTLLAAGWFALFALPLFFLVPDRGPGTPERIGGWKRLLEVLRRVRREPVLLRFLIANMIYMDGLNTLFAFGGIYAAGTFGMPIEEVLMFGIGLNVTAGLGAVAFAWLDDRIGARRVILISLVGLVALGVAILLVRDKSVFWGLGLTIGIFFGPLQSASRTMMARLVPPEHAAACFGLFAFSGKATAFVGPAVLSAATLFFESQRAGMASIMLFFALGWWLMRGLRIDATARA